MPKADATAPRVLQDLIIGDDAKLLASLSSVLSMRSAYLPVIDGPRMQRLDADAEVIRRNNAAARLKANRIFLVSLHNDARSRFSTFFPQQKMFDVTNIDGIYPFLTASKRQRPPLIWGNDRIGEGLLIALRERRVIQFSRDSAHDAEPIKPSSRLIVCEDRDEVTQVIAANYAYSVGANLHIVPEMERKTAEDILERLYSLYENRELSATEILNSLKNEIRYLLGVLPALPGGAITFISDRLPYGFAFPEFVSSHLFSYSDLGIAILNGLLAEQPDAPGIAVAVLVDPKKADAPEMRVAEKIFPRRNIFFRGYVGAGATVRNVSQMVEMFPYDFLMIATHCGDSPGWRWTYNFLDTDKRQRELIVDTAIGVSDPLKGDLQDDNRMLHVTQMFRFVSLDGVDWYDPEKEKKLDVGSAITTFIDRTRGDGDLKPTTRIEISRVFGSSVLQMFDHNYLPIPQSLACNQTPIILNNACGSWHRLAETFSFGNARAYIGTLFPVSTSEATDVAGKILDKHFGKPLPLALWLAQNETYEGDLRRPYIFTGVHEQRLRTTLLDTPKHIEEALLLEEYHLQKQRFAYISDAAKLRDIEDRLSYVTQEISGIRVRWQRRDR